MKTLITLAALAALTLQAQQTPAPAKNESGAPSITDKAVTAPAPDKPAKLTPEQAAKWKEINDAVKVAAEATEKAELVYLRSKDAYQKSQVEGSAVLVKMQTEAKCPGCFPQPQADGSLVWSKPATQ